VFKLRPKEILFRGPFSITPIHMTRRIPLFSAFALFIALAATPLFAQKHETLNVGGVEHDEDHFDKVLEWYRHWMNPANEDNIDAKLMNGYNQWLKMDNSVAMKATSSSSWVPVGTSQDGNVSGRATCISFEDTTSKVIYLGTSQGGLWKSVDFGATWVPLSESWATLAMGGVAVDPKNPSVVYAGTGDPYGNIGVGVYKSTNGGLDWNLMSSSMGAVTNMMLVSPDSDLVYHAGRSGVYLSDNGGESWSQVCSLGGITTIAIDPDDPSILFAGGAGVIKRSTDHGRTWAQVYNYSGASTMTVAVSANASQSNPKRIYASVSTSASSIIVVSKNGGDTFEVMSNNDGNSGPHYMWIQGWYANALGINPKNSNDILVGGLDIYRSTTGGASLDQKTVWTNPTSTSNFTHADVHFLLYNGSRLFTLTDGGVYYSTTNGDTWKQSMNKYLATFQFVGGDCDPDMTFFTAGAQDNGINKISKTAPYYRSIMGGDGGTTFVSQDDGKTIYGTYLGAVLYRSPDAGVSWVRSSHGTYNLLDPSEITSSSEAPDAYMEYDVSEADGGVVAVCGKRRVFLTTDGGSDQFPAITTTSGASYISGGVKCVHIAKSDPFTIFAAGSSSIYVTHDQGQSWTKSTTRVSSCTAITTDPLDPNKVYASIGGTTSAHFMVSTDGGLTWEHPATNLPNVNFKRIAVAPDGQIFMGHDFGVVRSQDGGATWYPVREGLPMVQITSMHIRNNGRYLVVTTYGRGMFYIDLAGLPPVQSGVNTSTANSLGPIATIESVYPNPVRGTSISVSYTVPTEGRASLAVYDVLGRQEQLLMNEWLQTGAREGHYQLENLAAGKHFLVLTSNGRTVTQAITIE
jgi:photosystem II stability/assembly factor-like uncharacterized protein